ncbi:MAG TPA: transglycosylase domain-containing protein [Gaiellales bacterium]
MRDAPALPGAQPDERPLSDHTGDLPAIPVRRRDPSPDEAVGIPRGRRRRKRLSRDRRRSRRSRLATAVLGLLVTLVTLLALAVAATFAWVDHVTTGLDINTMHAHLPGINSVIRDDHRRLLARIASTENRIPVPSRRISPWLKEATIAIEDRRFYQHGGVDYEATLRALWADVQAGQVVQGGSTIEQQLAKVLYLDDSQTLTRKVQEAELATQIADRWPRDRILTTYLNVVPYGGVTYGCQAAARAYFDTSCAHLTLLQAATLAGIPRSPTDYDPIVHREAALARRNEVLAAMAKSGDITAERAARLEQRPLRVHRPRSAVTKQPYFVQYVQQQLAHRYGADRLQHGGLVVRTTIDTRLQQAAQSAFHSVLSSPGDPAAAIVAMDPRTGAILAFDASTNAKKTQYDLPSQAHRQAGSAFKPFALLAAMVDDHIDPETTYYSSAAPFVTKLPGCDYNQPSCTWKVNNAEPGGGGSLDLHTALDGSVNAVFARLSMDIGSDRTVNMAYRLGIPRRDRLPHVPSIVLGTGLVSPLDMTTAYSTIASGGIYHRPLAVTSVTSHDGSIRSATPPRKNPGHRVIPAWAASEVTSILRDNITCRLGLCTGGGALLSPSRPQAGKTGTVESHQDAWFCGYTPNIAACVWMGFPKGEISMIPAVGSDASFGGGYPATIWHDFMARAFSIEGKRFPASDWQLALPPPGWYRPWTSHVTS